MRRRRVSRGAIAATSCSGQMIGPDRLPQARPSARMSMLSMGGTAASATGMTASNPDHSEHRGSAAATSGRGRSQGNRTRSRPARISATSGGRVAPPVRLAQPLTARNPPWPSAWRKKMAESRYPRIALSQGLHHARQAGSPTPRRLAAACNLPRRQSAPGGRPLWLYATIDGSMPPASRRRWTS
jgi:hypothetical protein